MISNPKESGHGDGSTVTWNFFGILPIFLGIIERLWYLKRSNLFILYGQTFTYLTTFNLPTFKTPKCTCNIHKPGSPNLANARTSLHASDSLKCTVVHILGS